MKNIVFATCRSKPDVLPDDVPLAKALEAVGKEVLPAAWNGPFEPFAEADLVVVRSTWDYHKEPHAFAKWLARLERLAVTIVNTPSLMLWNRHKGYLLGLAERGAPLPPTRLVAPTPAAIAAAMHELELQEAVVKPVFGASADGLSVVQLGDAASLERAAVAVEHDLLVQPLIAEVVSRGETSLTFLGGQFSHAVVKRPKAGSILVQQGHGGSTERVDVPADVVTMAGSILEMLPEPPLYARIDMVLTEQRALLMEVEVIEPELFLLHEDAAAQRFADLLLARLG